MNSIRQTFLLCFAAIFIASGPAQSQLPAEHKNPRTLKEAFKGKFYIGTALNIAQIRGSDKPAIDVAKTHFNSIVAENSLKSMYLQPEEGKFNFRDADLFVEFGERNG